MWPLWCSPRHESLDLVIGIACESMSNVTANLEAIHERIARAAEQSGRPPDDVTLIAVTKTAPVERILEAYSAGVRHFGENRVQEALSIRTSQGKNAAAIYPPAYTPRPHNANVVSPDLGRLLNAATAKIERLTPAGMKPPNRTSIPCGAPVAPSSLTNCDTWL